MGQSTWKSTKECIRIRAQLRNPINTQLPRRKTQAVGEAVREIWVADDFILFFFSFLSFYFIFFSFNLVLFSGAGCYRLALKLNAEFFSFRITTWNV